jgi:Ni2+-binding GTPase involved in maturation of urease and hydrogenase
MIVPRLTASQLVIIAKSDLADVVEFDEAAARRNIPAVRPGMAVLRLSAKTVEGMKGYLDFIESRRTSSRAAAAVAK